MFSTFIETVKSNTAPAGTRSVWRGCSATPLMRSMRFSVLTSTRRLSFSISFLHCSFRGASQKASRVGPSSAASLSSSWSPPPMRISLSEAPMRSPDSNSRRPCSFWILRNCSSIASALPRTVNFVKSHERFHEQAGLFERSRVTGLVDDAVEQRDEFVIDHATALRIGDLGLQHLDEGLMLLKLVLVRSDFLLQRHQLVIETAQLGGFVCAVFLSFISYSFGSFLGNLGIKLPIDILTENDAGDRDIDPRRLPGRLSAPSAVQGAIGTAPPGLPWGVLWHNLSYRVRLR